MPVRGRRLLLGLWVLPALAGAESRPGAALTFAADIRPLLARHCTDCHSGWFPKSGLRLDTLEHIREGGKSGPAIVPGDPAKGWLMRSLSLPEGRRYKMPPGPERLADEEVERIAEWIRQGAH